MIVFGEGLFTGGGLASRGVLNYRYIDAGTEVPITL
jgi:hypothetical protein